MRQNFLFSRLLLVSASLFILSCQKEINKKQRQIKIKSEIPTANTQETIPFDLNVVLRSEGNSHGHLKFRQDPDPAKIIELDIKVHHLAPNHEYLLQRAVDVINEVDGNCTSTSWLTLGKGLTPQSILTDEHGKGSEELWRDVSAVPSGSTFDIHFRVIDAVSLAVVLTGDCYQYQVR